MDTTIQVRVSKKTKAAAQKVFADMGIDLSSGVKLYLTQVVRNKSLLFVPQTERTVNGYTPAQEEAILRETALTEKRGKYYSDIDKLMKSVGL